MIYVAAIVFGFAVTALCLCVDRYLDGKRATRAGEPSEAAVLHAKGAYWGSVAVLLALVTVAIVTTWGA